MSKERPFFFDFETPLYAVRSGPERPSSCFIIVTGFGEEKKSGYRVLVDLCRSAAEQGIASLRFDLRGTGDSDFPFEQLSIEHWLDDIRRVFSVFSNGEEMSPSIVAVRFGCLLAAESDIAPNKAIMIAPPVSGMAYIREEMMRKRLRAAITGLPAKSVSDMETALQDSGVLDLDGIPLTRQLADGIKKLEYPHNQFFDCEGLTLSMGSPGGEEKIKSLFRIADETRLAAVPFWSAGDYAPLPILTEAVLRFITGTNAAKSD